MNDDDNESVDAELFCTIHNLPMEYMIDPFQQDVYNEEVWVWLCEECAQIRRDDI